MRKLCRQRLSDRIIQYHAKTVHGCQQRGRFAGSFAEAKVQGAKAIYTMTSDTQ